MILILSSKNSMRRESIGYKMKILKVMAVLKLLAVKVLHKKLREEKDHVEGLHKREIILEDELRKLKKVVEEYKEKEINWNKEEKSYRVEIADLKVKYKYLNDELNKFSQERNGIEEILEKQNNCLSKYEISLKNERALNKDLIKELNTLQDLLVLFM